MTFCRFIKSGCYYLRLYAACHVSNLLRSLINKKDYHVDLRVVVRNRVGYRLEQHGLTCLRLCYDESTLSLTYRSEHIDDTA